MKSGGFHGEIWQISDEIWRISGEIWQISGEIHPQPYKIRCFNKNSSVWGVHGGGYDPRFMKSRVIAPLLHSSNWIVVGWNTCFYKVLGGFHMKSTGFHLKSAGFHEIRMKSGGFHVSKDPLTRNFNPMILCDLNILVQHEILELLLLKTLL